MFEPRPAFFYRGGVMEKALWIGPRHSARDFKDVASLAGIELLEFDTVDDALHATTGIPIPIAIVAADWGDASPSVKKLVATMPSVVVLTATRLGVPMQIGLSLNAGAVNVIDLATPAAGDTTKMLQDALARHRRRVRERELLLRLRALNEDFLKAIVNLEGKNIALEQRLQGETAPVEASDAALRVLVVDDEHIVCEVIGSVLEQSGLLHDSAETGSVAVKMLEKQRYNAVITDKNLPDMSGLDVLRETKRRYPDCAVIVVTGYASKESAIEALNLGAEAYFEKPFDVATMSETVQRVLHARREKSQKQHYLSLIKQRNKDFLEQYRNIRQELEAALQQRTARKDG
jgi:CheY-like chemotaxis protein